MTLQELKTWVNSLPEEQLIRELICENHNYDMNEAPYDIIQGLTPLEENYYLADIEVICQTTLDQLIADEIIDINEYPLIGLQGDLVLTFNNK